MDQARVSWIVAGWVFLVLVQSCAQVEFARQPDRTLSLSAGQIEAKVVSILETPPFEYKILSRAQGKIRAQKEYPGDPYGLPFLGKRMNERTLVTVRLEPNPEASDSTNLFVDVTIEETEHFRTGWVPKDAPEKREEILSTLLQRLDEAL